MDVKSRYLWLASICAGVSLSYTAMALDFDDAWTLNSPTPQVEAVRPDAAETSPPPAYQASTADYLVPDVMLTDANGARINLKQFLQNDGPVLLQFVFASCSTICPILSAGFSSAQQEIDGQAGGKLRLISISIDPEQDTPEQLRAYAQRFKAGKHWLFLTGKPQDIQTVLKAFDATYLGNNKMFHRSLTFMRRSPHAQWLRIDGLLGKQALLDEYRRMMAEND